MLALDPHDPYPLITDATHAYRELQEHAAAVDSWLGLQTAAIEAGLQKDPASTQQLWIGLPVQSMLTPYVELRAVLHHLEPRDGSTLVDLGAGYGRMAFVAARHYPLVHFIGYEQIAERVTEARRCLNQHGGTNSQMLVADLERNDFVPCAADYYFIYDYGSRSAIEKTLEDLKTIARTRPIKVAARGGLSRMLIDREHPWLSQVVPPQHFPHFSIYRS